MLDHADSRRPLPTAPRGLPRVIGISGAAGSGKSTLADQLAAAHGYRRVKLADPLKAMLAGYYQCLGLRPMEVARRLEGDLKEEADPALAGVSPRHAMRTLGTEWGRGLIAEDFWIQAWRARARLGWVVTDDVRFEDEVAAIRSLGGLVVEVQRPGLEYSREHVSERGVRADAMIVNGGDKGALLDSAEATLSVWMGAQR